MKVRKKLSIWSALPPYLGGKRRLCPIIFREINRVIPRRDWSHLTFLDGFLGGGSVSLFAKAQGFRVVATDVAERCIVVGRAVIENSRVRLTREDLLRVLSIPTNGSGTVEKRYVPTVFPSNVARFLDQALAAASETADTARAALLRLLVIRVALLTHPMSQIRPGTIHRAVAGEWESITESCVHHYTNALRLIHPARLWTLAQEINAAIFPGTAEVHRRNVFDLLPEVEADIAYFDPPYAAVMSYEREYRILDEILEGAPRTTSPFTAREGARELDRLLESAVHIPLWVVSYGNEAVGVDVLEEKMRRFGRNVRSLAIPYKHLPAVATQDKKNRNREFLVLGADPALFPDAWSSDGGRTG